jgi:hypothetical protein
MSEINPRPGCYYLRILPDGREVTVLAMTFGKARLCIGEAGAPYYEDGYCYADPVLAVCAAALWSGEGDPIDGWHRHINSGRRRPDGDPTRETRYW